MQRISKLTHIQISLSLIAIGAGVTALAQPLATDTAPFRRLSVICPIQIFAGELADYSTKPASFLAEGPMRYVINGTDTVAITMPESKGYQYLRQFLATRIEITGQPGTTICVQYTASVTRRSAVTTSFLVDTTVCYAPQEALPEFIIFDYTLRRPYKHKPEPTSPVLYTNETIHPALLRRLRKNWNKLPVKNVYLQ